MSFRHLFFLRILQMTMTLGVGVGALSAIAAHADPFDYTTENRWWVFAGAGGGYNVISNSGSDVNKDGHVFSGRLLVSKYWSHWVADLGIGALASSISGSGNAGDVKINTNCLYAEFSPRYRFNEHWQLGPVVNMLFGTDVSFSEYSSDAVDPSFMGGARVDYEFPEGNWAFRVGAQATASLGLTSREMFSGQLDFQIGIPLSARATPVEERRLEPEPEPMPSPSPTPRESHVKVNAAAKELHVYLVDTLLRFSTGKAVLAPSDIELLTRLSLLLSKNENNWKTIEVGGHSDIRGSKAMNDRLSAARAASVKKLLVAKGIPAKRIQSHGYGYSQPIDPAHTMEAYNKNRRVEITLQEVSESDRLGNEIDAVIDSATGASGPNAAPTPSQ